MEMSEQCEMAEESTAEEMDDEGPWQNGVVSGIPGKTVRLNGILDLRGVPAEQVAAMESLTINGIVLLDEANRNGLAEVETSINGSTVVADSDLRVIIQPDMEFSKAAVEAMAAGQKMMLVGNVFFKPDVPPELIAEKFERLHVVGILIACEGVQGALLGKMESTGISITLPDDVGEVVRSMGANEWTKEYVERLADGTTYVNIGATEVPEDVSESLVQAKIATYHNIGVTEAAEPVLSLLKARCKTNMGQFSAPGEEDPGETCEEECE
jgi:hypothetical protein